MWRIAFLEMARPESPSKALEYVLSTSLGGLGEKGYVLFLPENWISGGPVSLSLYSEFVEKIGKAWGGPVFAGLSYVVEGGEVKSVGLAWLGNRVVRVCEKIFPSKAVGERGKLSPGKPLGPFEVNGLRVACIACVDIFYPEVARRHVLRGAQLLYNPASIPLDRVGLWHSILSARAAENTVYVLGVNNSGTVYPDGRVTGGGSGLYGPDGARVPGRLHGRLVLVDVDTSKIGVVRERWAFYEDLSSGRTRSLLGV